MLCKLQIANSISNSQYTIQILGRKSSLSLDYHDYILLHIHHFTSQFIGDGFDLRKYSHGNALAGTVYMMALATYQLQGSCSSFPATPSFHANGRKNRFTSLKSRLCLKGRLCSRKDRFISLKSRCCSSDGASLVLGPKSKLFEILAFKGSSQHDDSRGRTNSSNFLQNSAKVSYLQHESEESSVGSSEVQMAPYASADETGIRSRAIQELFKKWLLLMRSAPQTQPVNDVLEEPSSVGTSEVPNTVQNQGGAILKSVWFHFLGPYATIKIPLLIFTPLYVAVNLAYGPVVSKELTPLWILGPLAVALYIKIFRTICALYVFTFKQTVPVVKKLPAYYLLAHEYIVRGKLKEFILKHIQQNMEGTTSMDYNEVSRGKMKDLQGWLVERYLDFVELIWPRYCRTIRFLKRAKFI